MPLELFALITPLGIALIVLIIRYSGLSKTVQIGNSGNAIKLFLQDHGGENVSGTAIISMDKRAAFIEMDTPGQIGFVEAIGDRFITRLLGAGDIASFEQLDGNGLSVRFHDFTHPKGQYEFSNPRELSDLIAQLIRLEKQQ